MEKMISESDLGLNRLIFFKILFFHYGLYSMFFGIGFRCTA